MPDSIKTVQVIINPASGQDAPMLAIMNRAFRAAKVDWDVKLTKEAGDAERFAREAIAAGVDAVGVYGGDGTVMEVASGMNGANVPLAIFPGGSANVMSVELGIPGNLEEAVALVCSDARQIRQIDMGRLGDQQMFMLRLGVGFFAETTKGADREVKNRVGVLAYGLSALQALPKAQKSVYTITLDGGETVQAEGMAAFIANSISLGVPGLTLTKKTSVSDGLLDVIVLSDITIGSLMQAAANAVGLAQDLPHWQAKSIKLEADPPQSIECDGEIIHDTPVTATVVPNAVSVIVPNPETIDDAAEQVKAAEPKGD
ncbi:MAG: diacylglycerol kinase family lipid kinase [Chloroflexi bacterium]|nr:diacylglycerol kinase family lipid kinase [Chloroflexota bacterium]